MDSEGDKTSIDSFLETVKEIVLILLIVQQEEELVSTMHREEVQVSIMKVR